MVGGIINSIMTVLLKVQAYDALWHVSSQKICGTDTVRHKDCRPQSGGYARDSFHHHGTLGLCSIYNQRSESDYAKKFSAQQVMKSFTQ